jgi:hypothetical protein
MSSLLQKFPGLSLNDINPIPYEARFTSADAGSINLNAITWDNVLSDVHKALSSQVYYIDTFNFSVNLDKDVFLDALDPAFNRGFFKLDIISKDDKEVLNKSQINFADFAYNRQIGNSYSIQRSDFDNQEQQIQFRLSGQILQTNEVIQRLSEVGATTLDIYVSTVIYAINNQKWASRYFIEGGNRG